MNGSISSFLAERIAANDFPSAVYLVAEKGEVIYRDAVGYAVAEPDVIPSKPDTIYDVASLTKVLMTAPTIAVLIENGELELDSRIGELHAAFNDSDLAGVTIRQLASHTSGLPAWIPLYLFSETASPEALIEVIKSRKLNADPAVEYSDLNFITLALIAAHLLGNGFELGRSIIDGLKLDRTCFNPLSSGFKPAEIAASEKGNEYEKQTCLEKGFFPGEGANDARDPFRKYQIWGEVHDGNAWFMGGVAGHAGLFSTAEEVFRIALQFLPKYTTLLNPLTCEVFRTCLTKGLNEDRSFAFQLASTEGSTAGTTMSPESFGHNGFTGTSLWIDPVKDRIFVLLTNRTHHHPLPFMNINSVRRQFHDLAIRALESRE